MSYKNSRTKVDVIVPVYGGFEETVAAIETAVATIDPLWANLIVINDCSPEPEITSWLRSKHEEIGFVLLENDTNLGFVGTANRGMGLNSDRDVLLLNSDVEVANNWLERLQDTAYRGDNVASVTATANNATICSFPVFCEDNELPFNMQVSDIDSVFEESVPARTSVEIPTAVGCCMYIRRDALNRIGLFDVEAFGRGYGEENDWSQRAIKEGLVNLHALNVFVYHKGGVSFAAESDPRKQANLEIVKNRHPNYIDDVQRFITEDPAAAWRVKTTIDLIASQGRPVILAVSHGLGGGVKTHILEMARELRGAHFIQLDPISEGRVRLKFFPEKANSPYLDFCVSTAYSALLEVLTACGVCHVHFHHTMRLPTRIWGIADELKCKFDYTLHDFWVVNGNPTQTDANGRYVGGEADADMLCQQAYPLPKGVAAEQWRENQLVLMKEARYLICPSGDTLKRLRGYKEFSGLSQWVEVPHLDSCSIKETGVKHQFSSPLKVAVIGALSREKGADILETVADALKKKNIEFHLLGFAYRELSDAVVTHGAYPEEECLERLKRIEPDVVWFTARWPETYSYTLSVALKADYPIIAPNIGAFPERLSGRSGTLIWDVELTTKQLAEQWQRLIDDPSHLVNAVAPKVEGSIFRDENFYFQSYMNELSDRPYKEKIHIEMLEELIEKSSATNNMTCSLERGVFLFLLRLKKLPGLRRITKYVPPRVQIFIKRVLGVR